MKRSTDRILASHAGVLPRPEAFQKLFVGLPGTEAEFEAALPAAVKEVVQQQVDCGMDVVNDGEISKVGGFLAYIRGRMDGVEQHPWPGEPPKREPVNGRDRRHFPKFYETGRGASGSNVTAVTNAQQPYFVVAPVTYTGNAQVQRDIADVKAACEGLDVEPFLPGVAPGSMEHWLWNEYYPSDEEFLFALADVLHDEFKQITDAGVILQVDDPDLPDGWQMFPDWSVAEYHKYAELRVDAINHALRDIPEELVRFHICWGSQHGPHSDDLPLSDFIDLVYKVKAECYSIEAANPQHEHEWRVFEEFPLPDGKILMPGVVGHATDIIEHPVAVSDRIVRYANIVGRENVIAGTDCGLASRVGGPEINWAKLAALGAGAEHATKILFG
jgi:5-methyltetrahydropteroyltriglutamate--homocysteine methyltransferase